MKLDVLPLEVTPSFYCLIPHHLKFQHDAHMSFLGKDVGTYHHLLTKYSKKDAQKMFIFSSHFNSVA